MHISSSNNNSNHLLVSYIFDGGGKAKKKVVLPVFLIRIRFSLALQPVMSPKPPGGKQGCIKFLIPHPWGWGNFIKSYGEEFQAVKRGRESKGFWEEYHVEKKVRGSNIICSIILRP